MSFGHVDPLYYILLGLGLLISFWASWRVKSTFKRYSQVRAASGLTGAEAAARLLAGAGIGDVKIVQTSGMLSDHYNPITKTLALSVDVYQSPSIAAIGVACHEAGHAIQHAKAYAPVWLRSLLVPTVGIGSHLGYAAMLFGLILKSMGLFLVGVALFSLLLLFQLVTLPVEFNASSRAKQLAFEQGLVTADERDGMARVLSAAAMTYIAALVSTLLTLFYFLIRAGLLGGGGRRRG
jgi:Zn-dependent membrane protease YugP